MTSFEPYSPPTDVGPDHTAATDSNVTDGTDTKRSSKRKSTSNASKNLGQNKRPRSGVRALTDKDEDKLAQLYTYASLGTMPFHQSGARAIAANAEGCARAWRTLADENDNVRRALLGILEGGAWSAVILAHMPIMVAFLPEQIQWLMPNMDSDDIVPDDSTENPDA